MNLDGALGILFVLGVTAIVVAFIVGFNRVADRAAERRDARRRNQARPWRR